MDEDLFLKPGVHLPPFECNVSFQFLCTIIGLCHFPTAFLDTLSLLRTVRRLAFPFLGTCRSAPGPPGTQLAHLGRGNITLGDASSGAAVPYFTIGEEFSIIVNSNTLWGRIDFHLNGGSFDLGRFLYKILRKTHFE
jgi:hypothetical protein